MYNIVYLQWNKTDNMNTYRKYVPNVYVAHCPEKHEKGEEIILTTRYGKEHECIVWNFLGEWEGGYLYSITRSDGFNRQEHYRQKAERYSDWAESREKKAEDWHEKSNEGREFLSLGEPIKIGHHSERRHRALIERNRARMDRAMENWRKAEEHERKSETYQKMADKIDLSMPESLAYFEAELASAIEYHEGLKSGKYPKQHSFDVQYANRRRKELEKKLKFAKKLWS